MVSKSGERRPSGRATTEARKRPHDPAKAPVWDFATIPRRSDQRGNRHESISRLTASAAVGGLVLLVARVRCPRRTCRPARSAAHAARSNPRARVAAVDAGSIHGQSFRTNTRAPISGALVSALGATKGVRRHGRHRPLSRSRRCRPDRTSFARTSQGSSPRREDGRSPPQQPHIIVDRSPAHCVGRDVLALVPADGRANNQRAHASARSRCGTSRPVDAQATRRRPRAKGPRRSRRACPPADDDHSELAWRLRHARRSILQDANAPAALIADDSSTRRRMRTFGPTTTCGRSVSSSARLAANLFAGRRFPASSIS